MVIDGIEKKVEYSDKVAKGIYMVSDNNQVIQNCKILKIELGDNIDPNEIKQRVTKIENAGLLTTRILNEHFQYIFKDYADKNDVDQFIKDFPDTIQVALREAYNLSKI